MGGRGFTLLGNSSGGRRLLPEVSRQETFLQPFLKVVTKCRVGITYAGHCRFFLTSCGCRGMHSSSGARLNQTHGLRTLVVHCAGKGGFSETSADDLAINFHGQGERLAIQHPNIPAAAFLLHPLRSTLSTRQWRTKSRRGRAKAVGTGQNNGFCPDKESFCFLSDSGRAACSHIASRIALSDGQHQVVTSFNR